MISDILGLRWLRHISVQLSALSQSSPFVCGAVLEERYLSTLLKHHSHGPRTGLCLCNGSSDSNGCPYRAVTPLYTLLTIQTTPTWQNMKDAMIDTDTAPSPLMLRRPLLLRPCRLADRQIGLFTFENTDRNEDLVRLDGLFRPGSKDVAVSIQLDLIESA